MFSTSAIEKIKTKRIYALEGNIGAGKTTIMKIISNHFNDVEFVEEPVKEWQNLGGMNLLDAFYSDPKRWGFTFEFYSMLTKIQALLKAANSDKPINLNSLDVIISVGYRVKSVIGTRFRQWANRILKEYVLRGYAVNERFARLEQKVLKHEEQINLVLQTALPPIQSPALEVLLV